MKIDKRKYQRGNAIVMAVSFAVLASLGVLYVMNKGMGQRSQVKRGLKKTASFYAMEAARQSAEVAIKDFVRNRLTSAYDSVNWSAGNSGGLALLDPGNVAVNSGIHQDNFFATISDQNQWETLEQSGANARKHNYKYVMFNDINGNGNKDTGEEGFVLLQAPPDASAEQRYTYRYNITATGKTNEELESALITGEVSFGLTQPTFAQYGMFTDTNRAHASIGGYDVWYGFHDVMDGPVHTNGRNNSRMNFIAEEPGTLQSATFKGRVTSSSQKIGYYKYTGGNRYRVDNPPLSNLNPRGSNGVTPTFEDGYQRGVPEIDLPANSYSQERAALGGNFSDTSGLNNAEKRSLLGMSGSGSVPNGIYTPNDGSGHSTGGIFVQGDVDEMIMSVDSNGKQQIYIRQGSGGSAKRQTITIDPSTHKMVVRNENTGSESTFTDATRNLIHVEGEIKSVGGPPRQPSNSTSYDDAPPAIQKDMPLTLSATGDIKIQRDLKYEADPRGADGEFGTADDDLTMKNMLGIYSSDGNVMVGTHAPDNVAIHGSVMATKPGQGMFMVENLNRRRVQGDIHLLGGVIQDHFAATAIASSRGITNGYGYKHSYDRRFAQASPPFFPTTDEPPIISDTVINLLDWQEKNRS